MKTLVVQGLCLPFILTGVFGANSVLPSAAVTAVTATSPVTRATPAITVSAVVTPTFDSNSGPTTVQTCTSCSKTGNYCGTGNSAVRTQQVLTTTTVAVGNLITTIRAAPEFAAANPTIAGMTGPGGSGVYTGALPTPFTETDGNHNVTVSAFLSEDVTTTTTVTTKNMSGSSCGGSILSSVPGTPRSSTVTKYGGGSGTGTYVLDINPPVLSQQPITSPHIIKQGGNKVIHNVLSGGSALANYFLVDAGVGPLSSAITASGADRFGAAGQRGGIAPDKHDMISLHVPCGCPVGEYTLDPAATIVNTADLAGNPFPPITTANVDSWTVVGGESLQNDTVVVSELSSNGDYAELACFTSTLGGSGGNRRVSAYPGSLHITATINTTGDCTGFGNITFTPLVRGGPASVSLTLPPDFSFDSTGTFPIAHVFIGPAAKGFDLHYPMTLTEVTGLLPSSAITKSPDNQTAIVDLSALDLGWGKGVVPASNTIYVRAHAIFSGVNIPADGTQYTFSTSTTAVLPGSGAMTTSSTQTVTALPAVETSSYKSCIDGNFKPPAAK